MINNKLKGLNCVLL